MSNDNWLGIRPMTVDKPEIHKKGWGEEVWIANNEAYCGKLLKFNKGAEFSMHYHMLKHETFYVLKGTLLLKGINLHDASPYEAELKEGDVLTIPAGNPHKIIAHEEAIIVEVSTQHFESDSYRIQPGNSQKKI